MAGFVLSMQSYALKTFRGLSQPLRTGRVNGESTETCCLCKLVHHLVPTQDKSIDSLCVYVSQYLVISDNSDVSTLFYSVNN